MGWNLGFCLRLKVVNCRVSLVQEEGEQLDSGNEKGQSDQGVSPVQGTPGWVLLTRGGRCRFTFVVPPGWRRETLMRFNLYDPPRARLLPAGLPGTSCWVYLFIYPFLSVPSPLLSQAPFAGSHPDLCSGVLRCVWL